MGVLAEEAGYGTGDQGRSGSGGLVVLSGVGGNLIWRAKCSTIGCGIGCGKALRLLGR